MTEKPLPRDIKPNFAVYWEPWDRSDSYFCLLFTLGNRNYIRATGEMDDWDEDDEAFAKDVQVVSFPLAFAQGGYFYEPL